MPALLAVALLPVVLYCSLRAVAPRVGGASAEHRRDIDVWHVLMGTAMAAMLLGLLTRPLALLALGACAAALCWGVLAVERREGSAAHARLVVGAGAMAVMTLPLAAPAMASTGQGSGHGSGHGSGDGMAGMSMAGASWPLVVVLLAGLVMVAAVRLPVAVRRSPGAVARLDAGCDVVMAVAMAAMLAVLL